MIDYMYLGTLHAALEEGDRGMAISAAAELEMLKRKAEQLRHESMFPEQDSKRTKLAKETIALRSPRPELRHKPKRPVTFYAKLYGMAMKYGVQGLQRDAYHCAAQVLSGTWSRKDLAKALQVAFSTTGDDVNNHNGLCKLLTDTILASAANLTRYPTIEDAINSIDGLPYWLFKELSKRSSEQG